MGRILAAFVTLLILVIVAAFAAPSFVDWNAYRGPIERTASGIVHWTVKANGPIDITLLPEPRIRLSQVTAQSPGGAANFSVETADIGLSLQALLGGRIEADTVTLVHPVLAAGLGAAGNTRDSSYLAADAAAVTANIAGLRIVGGQALISAPDYGPGKTLSIDNIEGNLTSQSQQAGAFRFAGSAMSSGRQIAGKFSVSSGPQGKLKFNGTLSDAATKTAFSADGVVTLGNSPAFDGALSASGQLPASETGAPVALQARSAAHASLTGVALDDLTITLDPEDRPQTVTGAASIAFLNPGLKLSLTGPSLDLTPAAGNGESRPPPLPSVWMASPPFLQFHPEAEVRVSLGLDHTQIAGEGVDNVKLDAKRSQGRWVIEKMHADLPGDTSLSLAGTVGSANGKSQASGVVALDGRNLKRFAKWAVPQQANGLAAPASPFTLSASVTVSDVATAVEGASGTLDGAPFRGSFRYENAPARKVSVRFAADALNLSEGGMNLFAVISPASDVLRPGYQPVTISGTSFLQGVLGGAETADVDVAVKSVKTASADLHNLAARITIAPDALTISRLNVETAEGFAIRGEGLIPSTGAAGRFEARLEARTADALLWAVQAAGYAEDDLAGRSMADFAPSAAVIKYETGPAGGPSIALTGNFSGTRFDARAALPQPAPAGGGPAAVDIQFNAAAVDGGKLLAQLYPQGAPSGDGTPLPAAAQGPGTFTVRLAGPADKLVASLALKTVLVQAQFDGTAAVKNGSIAAASGRVSMASASPDVLLPAPVLAFLGGEPRSPFRVEAAIAAAGLRVEATEIKAETAGSATTGRLLLDRGGKVPRLEGELRAGKASLPSMLGIILGPVPQLTASASPGSVWPERPFALSTLQGASSHIVLAAKTLKLGEALDITDAQAIANLENGRLTLEKVRGKLSGADITGSASLEAKNNLVTASAEISLDDFDLMHLTPAGKPPVASGTADITVSVSGRALSPRGLIAVLKGRGTVALSSGQLYRISPAALQTAGEEMAAQPAALPEDAIFKRAGDAIQAGDFKFSGLKTAFSIDNGVAEVTRGSFASKEGGTVKVDALIDLASLKADSTLQITGAGDRKQKFPPVKLTIAGPLESIETWPRSFSAEDFARSILVQKMDRDLTKLETLSKVPQPLPPWTTTQEPPAKPAQRRSDGDALPVTPAQGRAFEDRIKGSLRPRDGAAASDNGR